jgi:beta-glucosidase
MTDTSSETRIDELLHRMTLEEKAALTVGRDFWTTWPVERLGIPSIWFSDGPTGLRKALGSDTVGIGDSRPATCFPTESALASSWDTQLLEEVGRALGREAQSQGVQVLLGPGANLKRSPLGGRNFEYFSEDPVLTGEMAAAYIRGVQSEGVGTSLKHFAANEQETGRMYADSVVDERTLREVYLRAFEIAVTKARPWTVMAAYNRLNGMYCTENRRLLHNILKEEWGHQGIVVSDWFAVNDRAAGIAAGLHLQMPGGPTAQYIVEAVLAGSLEENDLDEMVRDLLQIILQADAARRPDTTIDEEEDHRLARRAAGECIVLLKNEDGLLPIDSGRITRLAVIGTFAKEPRYQGAGSSQVVPTRVENALAELVRLLGDGGGVKYAPGYDAGVEPDAALVEEAQCVAAWSEVAVVFVGLPAVAESEGMDRKTLDLPDPHSALVEAVLAVQPRTVVVLTNGSTVALPWAARVPAIVEGWLAGQAGGGAIADVLLGIVNPSGKLSETFPVRLEDTPAYQDFPAEPALCLYGERLWTGHRWYDARQIQPLFPFGHGLSYTTFEYSNLRVEPAVTRVGETLTVSCTVRNAGRRAGREIVQLYLHECSPRLDRPERELRGFTSASLQVGEETRVCIELHPRDFAIYDPQAHGWVNGGGTFDLLVGASSRDVRLQTSIVLEGAGGPTAPLTRFSPIRAWMEHPTGSELLAPYLAHLRQAMDSHGVESTSEGVDPAIMDMPVSKLQLAGVLSPEDLEQLIRQADSG